MQKLPHMLLTRCAAACCAVTAALAAGGCASGTSEATLPKDGPSMAEVYRQHMTGNSAEAPRDKLPLRAAEDSPATAYTRSAGDEIDNRFPRLANPDLVMYIAPHLSGAGRYPIPGYSTVFPMYESVEYAMPGEQVDARRRQSEAAPPANPPAVSKASVARSDKDAKSPKDAKSLADSSRANR